MPFIRRNKDYLKLSLMFFIAQGWMLLNDGFFWDDWVWYNNPSETSKGMIELGFGPAGQFLEFIYTNPLGVHFSKLIIFSLYLIIGLIFRKTLDFFQCFSNREKFFLAALFLLAPLNLTKHCLCVANNALNSMLFYSGSYIAIKNQVSGRKSLLIISLALIFLSYFTNSFLPFTTILYLAMLYRLIELYGPLNKGLLVMFLRKNYLYVISPLIFWLIKKLYFDPSGVYATYNVITIPSIQFLLKGSFKSVSSAFLAPISYLVPVIPKEIPEVLVGIFLLFMIFKCFQEIRKNIASFRQKFAFGLLAFMVATLPYVLVGKIGNFSSYASRHQLLQPLGFAFLIFYLLSCLKWTKKKVNYVLCLTLLAFISINIKVAMEFQAANFKQLAMMSEIKKNPIFLENRIFLIETFSEGPSNYFPKPSFYALTGMFYEVFGDQTRIAASSRKHLMEAYEVIPDSHKARYKMKNVIEKKPEILVNVSEKEPFGALRTMYLLVISFSNPKLFSDEVDSLLSFKYTILK